MSNTQKAPSGRVTRTNVAMRSKLTVKGKEDGFEYYIALDNPGRVEELIDRGYEHVKNADVKVGDKRGDSTASLGANATVQMGGGRLGYVMRIKKEWYDEDQAAKAAEVDSTEAAMRREKRSAKNPSEDGVYGEVQIGR